jgi:tetratricopeptide (TPR) repeat protein
MTHTVFLSCVTNEFGTLRPKLARMVQRTQLLVRHQDDFAHHGVRTLQMLEEEVLASDAVFHVVGNLPGANAPAAQVEDFLKRHPEFAQGFPEIAEDGRKGEISYTQWEAWLALLLGKRLVVYQVKAPAPAADTAEPSQKTHLERLKSRKVYPKVVPDVSELLEEIRISLIELHLLTRQDLEGPPCNLPYSPLGELFIGRGPFLDDLRRRFDAARRKHPGSWPNHAVTGMAGVGKTRLAIEYAWKHQEDYSALLFVNGESPTLLDSHLAGLAGVLRLGLPADAGDPDKRAAVLDWLRRHPGWLLIVDNVDDRAARDGVNAYLKEWHHGHVLITGRYVDWGKDVERLGLHVLSADDAADFLQKSTTERQAGSDDAATARQLADDLGGLCLALEQCSAYVNRLRVSLAEYRRRWQTNVKNVRGWADNVLMKYHEEKKVSVSIATTWQTTMAALSPPVRELLHLLCWLAPEPIPRTFLDAVESEQQFNGDPEEAAAELRSYSLLQRPAECDFETPGEVHRLVQLITREQLTADDRQSSLPRAVGALNAAFTGNPYDVRSWPVLNPLAAHVDEAVHHADAAGIVEPTARLMIQLGLLYKEQIRFPEAETLCRRALAIDEQSFGKDHPAVATDLSNLAQLLHATNRLAEAEPLMRRALAIYEQSFGEDHPNVAVGLNDLAQLLQDTNRLAEAEPLMRRVLAIGEQSFGKDHPKVAFRLNNLARLLHATNRLSEAEPLMRRALAIDEQSFGKDHPNVARGLNNLAQLLRDTNRLAEAEPLMRRALAIYEQSFGKNHPNVATALNNLAGLLQDTDRLAEAEPLMRRALGIFLASLGVRHPSTQTVKNNYAGLLMALGRDEQEVRARLNAVAEPLGMSFDN